jgi:hypothetical protein
MVRYRRSRVHGVCGARYGVGRPPAILRRAPSSRHVGRLSITISDGELNSQWLRLVSLGENLGQDSNVAIELRSITGSVNALTVPGVNFAVSYHSRFVSGDELYVAHGTPAATQTLNRFIVKYGLHEGIQN